MTNITHILQTHQYQIYLFIFTIVVAVFIFRRAIINLMTAISSYKQFTDYSVLVHRHRDTIVKNKKAFFKNEMNFKNAIAINVIILTMLVSSLLSAILLIAYRVFNVRKYLKQIKNFAIYDVSNDDFIEIFNQKMQTINTSINQILYTAYALFAIFFVTKNTTVANVATTAILIVLLANILAIYNTYHYRLNFKQSDFFKSLRLITASAFNDNNTIIVLFVMTLFSSYMKFSTVSNFLVIVLAINVIIKIVLNKILKEQDKHEKIAKELKNREYALHQLASSVNYKNQYRGYKFATPVQVKLFSMLNKSKSDITLSNYAFFNETIEKSELATNPILRHEITSNVKLDINVKNLTQQMLLLGGMGSGKTQYILNLVNQALKINEVKAIAFNDKKGDFISYYYDESKDIIVNIFDERATQWCPFLEMQHNPQSATAFTNNIFESVAGQDKDFFAGRAKQLVSEWFESSFYESKNDNKKAWSLFFEKINRYTKQAKEADDKTALSVAQTISIMTSMLKTMKHLIVDENKATFTFYDFVRSEEKQKLFFANRDEYKSTLSVYLAGLTGVYIDSVMSKPDDDKREHLILNIFDEFLTMKIDTATRETLLTATRSKSFCNILSAQFLTKKDEILQQLNSSYYLLVCFSINDSFTLEQVSSKLAEAEYMQISSNEKAPVQNGGGIKQGDDAKAGATNMLVSGGGSGIGAIAGIFGGGTTKSYSVTQSKMLITQQLQSMPKYSHICFIPSEDILELPKLEEKSAFKAMIFKNDEDLKFLTKDTDFIQKSTSILILAKSDFQDMQKVADSFIAKDINSSIQMMKEETAEQQLFKHYMNVKFLDEKNAIAYIKENDLENASDIFTAYEADEKAIARVSEKYSNEELKAICEEFYAVETLDKQYDIIKKYQLKGAMQLMFDSVAEQENEVTTTNENSNSDFETEQHSDFEEELEND